MFAVFRLEKYKRCDVHGINLERNRTANDDRNFKNNIDKTATDFNIELIHQRNFNAEISRQIQNAGVKEKPDSVVMIGGLYTASPDYFTPNPNYKPLTPEQQTQIANGTPDPRPQDQRPKYLYDDKAKSYFEDCLQFHIETYCQGDRSRVLSAKIDMDETTPHMQIYSIPLQERTNKKGISKMHLCAKQIIGDRTDLRRAQDSFFERIGKPRDMQRGDKVDWDKPYAERKKHEETYAHQQAERKAQEAAQQARMSDNEKTIEQQEARIQTLAEAEKDAGEKLEKTKQEEEKTRLKLEKEAEAADKIIKSMIKKLASNFFRKDKQERFTMEPQQYQAVISLLQQVKKIIEDPVYIPAERRAMQEAESRARQAERSYKEKEKNLDQHIEQAADRKMALLNHTAPNTISRLEAENSRLRKDGQYMEQVINQMAADMGLSIEQVEQRYSINLGSSRERER